MMIDKHKLSCLNLLRGLLLMTTIQQHKKLKEKLWKEPNSSQVLLEHFQTKMIKNIKGSFSSQNMLEKPKDVVSGNKILCIARNSEKAASTKVGLLRQNCEFEEDMDITITKLANLYPLSTTRKSSKQWKNARISAFHKEGTTFRKKVWRKMVFVLPRIGQEKSQQVVDSCKYAVDLATIWNWELLCGFGGW